MLRYLKIILVVFLLLCGYFIYHFWPRTTNPVYHITIPEGTTREGIAKIYSEVSPHFDSQLFLKDSEGLEGQLFPDTYFVGQSTTEDEFIKLMQDNFKAKLATLAPALATSTRSQNEILTMASIIEEEGKTTTDRRLISGILWKRYDARQLLEVDAATSTYSKIGLPTMPITNPGLESIEAALNPGASPYWFYLSDKHGTIHYAKTFDEHKHNKQLYLK